MEERRHVRTSAGRPRVGEKKITQVTHARVNRSHSDRRAVRIRTDRRPRSAESGCRPSRLARPLPPPPSRPTTHTPHRSATRALPHRSPAQYRTVLVTRSFPYPCPPAVPTAVLTGGVYGGGRGGWARAPNDAPPIRGRARVSCDGGAPRR